MDPLKDLIVNCCRKNREREKVKERRTSSDSRNAAGKRSKEDANMPARGSKESEERRIKGKLRNLKDDKKPKQGSKESKSGSKKRPGSKEKPKPKEDKSKEESVEEVLARSSEEHPRRKGEKKKNSKSGEVVVAPAAGVQAEAADPIRNSQRNRKGKIKSLKKPVEIMQAIQERSAKKPVEAVQANQAVQVQEKSGERDREDSFVDYWLQPDGTAKKAATGGAEQPKPTVPETKPEAQAPAGIELSVVNEPAKPEIPAKPQDSSAKKKGSVIANKEPGAIVSTPKLAATQSGKSRQKSARLPPMTKEIRTQLVHQKIAEKRPAPAPRPQLQQQQKQQPQQQQLPLQRAKPQQQLQQPVKQQPLGATKPQPTLGQQANKVSGAPKEIATQYPPKGTVTQTTTGVKHPKIPAPPVPATSVVPVQPPRASTPRKPVALAVVPTAPAVVPSATAVAPTAPAVVPSATAVAPTVASVAPSATVVAPTVASVAPSATAVDAIAPAVPPPSSQPQPSSKKVPEKKPASPTPHDKSVKSVFLGLPKN